MILTPLLIALIVWAVLPSHTAVVVDDDDDSWIEGSND